MDQEGGRVQRLAPPLWSAYPAAARFDAELGAERRARSVRLAMRLIAHDLREVGVTVDCAPGARRRRRGDPRGDRRRAPMPRPARVAALARAAMAGLLAGGVAPVVKHIPGHGRARVDSHLELPVVTRAARSWSAISRPFRALARRAGGDDGACGLHGD